MKAISQNKHENNKIQRMERCCMDTATSCLQSSPPGAEGCCSQCTKDLIWGIKSFGEHRESSPFPHDNNPGHLFDQIRRFNAKFSFKYGPFFKNLIFIPMSESFGHLMRGEPEKQQAPLIFSTLNTLISNIYAFLCIHGKENIV